MKVDLTFIRIPVFVNREAELRFALCARERVDGSAGALAITAADIF